MEKNLLFKDLKANGTLPKLLLTNFPELSKIILRMTLSDPTERPSCNELIKMAERELGMDFIANSMSESKMGLAEGRSLDLVTIKKKKSRSRFFSEDLCSIRSYELRMKNATDTDWRKM